MRSKKRIIDCERGSEGRGRGNTMEKTPTVNKNLTRKRTKAKVENFTAKLMKG